MAISKAPSRIVKRPSNDLIATEIRIKIRSMILASELKAGQRLVEDELSAALGVGRTPVREALLLLQGEGYITRERGWVVREVHSSKVRSIFEGRAAIEGAAARLAARRINLDDCDRLAELVEAMEPGANIKRHELNQMNTDFHNLIVKAADSELLSEFHERTQFYYWLLRIPIMFSDGQLIATNDQHRVILNALLQRDADAAERAARNHVETTMEIVVPALHQY